MSLFSHWARDLRVSFAAAFVLVTSYSLSLPAFSIELEQKPAHLASDSIDVLRYAVKMTISELTSTTDAQPSIGMVERVRFQSREAGLRQLKLHFDRNRIEVDQARQGDRLLHFQIIQGLPSRELAGAVLSIDLETPVGINEECEVEISYRTRAARSSAAPNERRGLVFHPNHQGAAVLQTYDWPNGARYWLPSNDHPSDPARFEIEFHVPADSVAASNGELVGGNYQEGQGLDAEGRRVFHWVSEQAIPTYGLNIVVGGLRVIESAVAVDPATRIPRVVYHGPNDRSIPSMTEGIEKSSQALAYFSSLLGRYSFPKLGFAILPHPFNMENPSLITLINSSAAVHEVLHHWWGNVVQIPHWGDFWVSEGFTSYFTGLYDEVTEGRNSAQFCDQAPQQLNATAEVEATLTNIPYCKGASALADLRNRMVSWSGNTLTLAQSRELFSLFGRKLYQDYRFRPLSSQELVDYLRTQLSSIYAEAGYPSTDPAIFRQGIREWKDRWLVGIQ